MDNQNLQRLLNFVGGLQNGAILTLETYVPQDAKFLKRGTPLAGRSIHKWARTNYQIGNDYEGNVNKQREREGMEPTFEAQPHPWGLHLNERVIWHRPSGKLYLRARKLRELETRWFVDHEEVGYNQIAPFQKPDPFPENQGVDKPVIYRNPTLTNILALTYGGARYVYQELRELQRP
jgi:hypothetical protein